MSMAENGGRPTPEQIAASPIHQFIGRGIPSPMNRQIRSTGELLSDVAQSIGAPMPMFRARLQDPLDKVLIARGRYEADITDDQAREFARTARAITEKYELRGQEGQMLLMTFQSIIQLWAQQANLEQRTRMAHEIVEKHQRRSNIALFEMLRADALLQPEQLIAQSAPRLVANEFGYRLQAASSELAKMAEISELGLEELLGITVDLTRTRQLKQRLEDAVARGEQGDYTGFKEYLVTEGERMTHETSGSLQLDGRRNIAVAAVLPDNGDPLSRPRNAWEDPIVIRDFQLQYGEQTTG